LLTDCVHAADGAGTGADVDVDAVGADPEVVVDPAVDVDTEGDVDAVVAAPDVEVVTAPVTVVAADPVTDVEEEAVTEAVVVTEAVWDADGAGAPGTGPTGTRQPDSIIDAANAVVAHRSTVVLVDPLNAGPPFPVASLPNGAGTVMGHVLRKSQLRATGMRTRTPHDGGSTVLRPLPRPCGDDDPVVVA
jgi:hypothetical protein